MASSQIMDEIDYHAIDDCLKETVQQMVENSINIANSFSDSDSDIGAQQMFGVTNNQVVNTSCHYIPKKKAVNQSQRSSVVSVNNNTTAPVTFKDKKDWSGYMASGAYPPAISSRSYSSFTHVGEPYNGSYGGVVYTGSNKVGAACAWILAWSAPTYKSPKSPNKVYVECGPIAKYTSINWHKIKKRLDASGRYDSRIDQVTNTIISAIITNNGRSATVGASFGAL